MKLMRSYPDCPFLLSLGCRDARHLNSGELLDNVLDIAVEHMPLCNLCAIGVNCTHPYYTPDLVERIANRLYQENNTSLNGLKPFVMCYPNSGEEWDAERKQWKEQGVDEDSELKFANGLLNCWRRGARVLGGKQTVITIHDSTTTQ
jgi:homocysteine S-methyltransferase